MTKNQVLFPFSIYSFLLLSLLFSADSFAQDKTSFYFLTSTFNDSEPVPYRDFEKNWDVKFRGGNSALSYFDYKVGVTLGRWGIEYLSQKRAYISFNSEVADFANTIANQQSIIADNVPVTINIKSYEVTGGRLFYGLFNKKNFNLWAGVSFLQGNKLIDGTVNGNLTINSDKDYSFNNIVLDYYYSKDKFFDHQVAEPTGYGYAFDARMYFKPSNKQKIWIDVRNVLGKIYWRDAPHTIAVIESDNKTYDENGYVKIQALLKGKQITKNFTQYLPPYVSIRTELMLINENYLLFDFNYLGIKAYSSVGYKRKIFSQINGDISYDPLNKSVGLRMSHEIFEFSLLSDNLSIKNAYMLGILFKLKWIF